jgi:hypothetical protein
MQASPRAWPCVNWIVNSDDAEVVAQVFGQLHSFLKLKD